MSEDVQESLETRVVQVQFPVSDLERLKGLGQELGLTEGEVIKTALNYLHRVCEIRKDGEFFIAKVRTDCEDAPHLITFEPKPVLKKYGPVQVIQKYS